MNIQVDRERSSVLTVDLAANGGGTGTGRRDLGKETLSQSARCDVSDFGPDQKVPRGIEVVIREVLRDSPAAIITI